MPPATEPLTCRAILFDLDGTLVDTAPDLAGAMNHVLIKRGYAALPLGAVRDLVGNGARVLLARGFWGPDAQPPVDDDDFEEAVRDFLGYYRLHIADGSRLFPGVLTGLRTLRETGFKMAVATNKPEALTHALLELLELAPWFDAVVGGDSLAQRKPDPEPLWHLLERMHMAPEDAVMVGDSETDVRAARNARVRVVAVPYGYNKDIPVEALEPDRIAADFSRLPGLVALPGRATP